MRIPLALVPAGLASALVACGATPPPAPVATNAIPERPIHASLGLDGLYRPKPGGVHGSSACHTVSFGDPIRVANGVATLQTVPTGRLEGRLAPDGSVVIKQGRSALRGQFSGNRFNGSYSRTSCTFFLAYSK